MRKTLLILKSVQKLAILFLLVGYLFILIPTGAASALSGTFPDGTNDPGHPAGWDERTEVVQSGAGIGLLARESDYNVFIPAADYGQRVTITIEDACTSTNLNDYSQTTAPAGTYTGGISAELVSPDGTVIDGANYSPNGHPNSGNGDDIYNNMAGGYDDNCTGNNLVFRNVPTNPNFGQSLAEFGPDYYYIELKVIKRDVPEPGVKNYSVVVTGAGAEVTFAASLGNINASDAQPTSDAFAIWDAARGSNVRSPAPGDIAFYFNPDCNYKGTDVYLKWGGADDGSPYQPDPPYPISFDLIDTTTGRTVLHATQNTRTIEQNYNAAGQKIGGLHTVTGLGNEYSYNTINAGKLVSGDEYEWRWNDVAHLNGINIWMPFSDVNTQNKCPLPCAGNATPNIAIWQPGDSPSVKLTFNASPVPETLNYQIPALGINNTVALTAAESAAGSYTIPAGVIQINPPNGANDYPISWTVTNATTRCQGTLHVTDIPYFTVYNGNVSAGGAFNACATTGGTLAGWYDNTGSKAGSSTLLADLADGKITGFASSQNTGAGPPGGQGNNLTFANSGGIAGADPSANFGGNYGVAHCLFTPAQPTSTTLAAGNGTIGTAPLVTGSVTHTGNFNLTGGQVNSGNNLALYVKGNIYIGSNITYGTDAGGTWAITANGTSDIPSFVLVAEGGNIYIDPSVKNLDGIYVAEKGSTGGGTIYTCGQNSYLPVPANSLYGCNNQLTVHGSFVADQVNLMRTLGTLKDSLSTENPWSGAARACTNGANSQVCAAEVFDFSPEEYLSNLQIQPPNNGATSYDSIASLPPVL